MKKLIIIAREEMRDVSFPRLPGGLITKPPLVWLLESDIAGK